MLQSNRPIVKAQQAIWGNYPDIKSCLSYLNDALITPYFIDDKNIRSIINKLEKTNILTPSEKIEIGRKLESRSLIGHYITRTRKREVDENRVERSAQVLAVNYSEIETNVYNKVSKILTEKSEVRRGFHYLL